MSWYILTFILIDVLIGILIDILFDIFGNHLVGLLIVHLFI